MTNKMEFIQSLMSDWADSSYNKLTCHLYDCFYRPRTYNQETIFIVVYVCNMLRFTIHYFESFTRCVSQFSLIQLPQNKFVCQFFQKFHFFPIHLPQVSRTIISNAYRLKILFFFVSSNFMFHNSQTVNKTGWRFNQ